MRRSRVSPWLLCACLTLPAHGADLRLVDAHIHYSEDAWESVPPARAIEILRAARLEKAFVSSSSDEGTQRLYALAPELVVPVLRPYRRRGETSTWVRDPSVVDYVESRLARYRYAGIGEFHVRGPDADLPVMRRLVALARERGLFLHAHADADAVERIFRIDPQARVLWAHAGFEDPDAIRAMLARHDNLWCELAFRSDHAFEGGVAPRWRELFLAHPDRFLVGTDTYTPDRWDDVVGHARWTRAWLADLPPDVARRIGHENAAALAGAWREGR